MKIKARHALSLPQLFLVLVFLVSFSSGTLALPTAVLSNFNQPSLGAYDPLSSRTYLAVPFVTDNRFTQLDGAEINAVTLSSPGNMFVQIWDIDYAGRPGNVVATLNGPPEPAGLTQYTGTVNLQPDTSYFLVIGVGNGASSAGTAVFTTDRNQADSQPPPIYRIGTDFNGDGAIDFVNKCTGSVSGSATISWVCGGVSATRFFPEFRILAEIPAPIVPPAPPSLISNPLFLDFGTITQGTTSAPLNATIENNGGVDQVFGSLSLASGAPFVISSDACSGATLAPGASCVIGVTFAATGGGQFSDTVIIPLSTDPSSPYGLQLVGEGDNPPNQSLTTTPAGLDFGVIDLGATTSVQSIRVENNGNVDQVLGALSVLGPFAIATDNCSGMTLTSAATCTVGITFSPVVAGLASGELQIPATGDVKSPYGVPLSGEGSTLAPSYSLTSTPLFLDFGLVPDGSTSAAQTAVIENDGNATQVLGAVSVGTGFALASDDCSGSTLAPGSTCSIDVTFSPVHGGVTSGTAIIPATSDPRSPYGLVLTGESDQPGIALPPSISTEPKAVPLRFTLLTALGLILLVAFRHRKMSRD